MIAMIKVIKEKYGSVEQYVLKNSNLTAEDLNALQRSALLKA
jgi:hypothetical protein